MDKTIQYKKMEILVTTEGTISQSKIEYEDCWYYLHNEFLIVERLDENNYLVSKIYKLKNINSFRTYNNK